MKAKTVEAEIQRRWKISQRLKGKAKSLEHRKKLSESRKGQFNFNINKDYHPLVLTEVDKAWLACALDTDGSVHFKQYSYSYPSGVTYSVYPRNISFHNTDKAFMEHITNLLDEPLTIIKPHNAHKGGKLLYRIRIARTRQLYEILSQIIPYLIIKRNKAEEICQFIQTRFMTKPSW